MTLTSRNTKLVHKVEFLFHTLPSLCYFATVLFQLYFPLAIFVNTNFSWPWLGVNISALAIFWIFYSLTLYRMLGLWRGLANQWRIAGIMVLCWGLSPLLAHAFMEGMISSDATFTRTPKRAATESVTDSMSTNMTGTPVESSTDSNASTDVMLTATVRVPVIASNTASPQTSSHSQASRDQGPSFASVSYATNMTTRTSATAVTDSESEASKSAVPSKRAKASYFTTKITFLPFFEFCRRRLVAVCNRGGALWACQRAHQRELQHGCSVALGRRRLLDRLRDRAVLEQPRRHWRHDPGALHGVHRLWEQVGLVGDGRV
eukprot:TRINITY_DN787_c0_g1_i10.p1 TRINITY_DN787_c0_g1~~TRINITY_DN787_c0_g1_i10.p1  ORF type:complete len:330 (-),score=73.13 TRINITY_DN787_c0_g1_i10:324-1280(-)